MQGVPVCVIHAMLVHSMVQATAQYSHLSPEGLGKAMEKTFGRS
jgi:site-specific recombinase XerD